MKTKIFLTGPPRIGKTTILLRSAEKLKAQGCKLGGVVSQELREKNVRVGFEICDYRLGIKGWLAHIRQPTGSRIGKYRVNLNDLNSIGATSILNALKDSDVVLIDEVGPMELLSEDFKEAVRKAIKSPQLLLGTIHYRTRHPFIKGIKANKEVDILTVTRKNRTRLPMSIVNSFIKFKLTETV
jgi:nucleoside-triphosphatase